MHLCVGLIWYFCTLYRHAFHSNDVPAVIWGRKRAWPELSGDKIDRHYMYFTIYQSCTAGWILMQYQYHTNLEGQGRIVSPPYSQDWYTGQCAWAPGQWNSLYWKIDMPLSHWQYVSVQKCQWWNCHQNPSTELPLIYGSQDVFFNMWNVLLVVRSFSGACECQLSPTKCQPGSSEQIIHSWTASAHSRWCHKSHSPAGHCCSPYQPGSRW